MQNFGMFLIAVFGGTAVVLGLLGTFVWLFRWIKRQPNRAGLFGWSLQLMGAGINPLPPPQEQLEAANRESRLKKQSESGDPEDPLRLVP